MRKREERACIGCGKVIWMVQEQRWCNVKCFDRARYRERVEREGKEAAANGGATNVIERECVRCKAKFVTRRQIRVFCGPECKAAAASSRQRAKSAAAREKEENRKLYDSGAYLYKDHNYDQ